MSQTLEQIAVTNDFHVYRISEFENLVIVQNAETNFDVKDFKGLRAEYAGKDMIFDAKSMLFIDAEGLRCLLDACKLMKNRGSYFDICNVQGNPQKVDCGRNPARIFHITGVRHLFTGYQNNLDQALEAYKAYIQQSAKVE